MKVWHIVHGHPIGPTWEAFVVEPVIAPPTEDDFCGTWAEYVELADLVREFAAHVAYAREHFPPSYGPYALKVHL